ncbi:hypothetical protein [Methylobacterium sp. WL120]|uniref:hypothetical protein n=1 Tax=Methylobacterium sp. WL120 TaxID=2603887 RepID=UPI0011C7906B|nr:hypothetical protein [Methylobacterium sp. WL120]TXM70691.1 hypothetical protein FV229_01610 [Methylobacterium sp. WL120]
MTDPTDVSDRADGGLRNRGIGSHGADDRSPRRHPYFGAFFRTRLDWSTVAALLYAFLLLLALPNLFAPTHRMGVAGGCGVHTWRNPVTGRDEVLGGALMPSVARSAGSRGRTQKLPAYKNLIVLV